MTRNIFVVGLEEFNLRLLRKVRHADDYAFHSLLDYEAVCTDPNREVNDLLTEAFAVLDAFPGKIDAIVGYWDFPTILMLPILRRRYGLRGPTLESVLKCEHKFWARLEQKKAIANTVPPFATVNPFLTDSHNEPPLPFPFWIKPVKAHSSKLGFMVRDLPEYRTALEATRNGIHRFAVGLNQIMEHADVPSEIRAVDGWHCIAEGVISSGRQCTLEGYVYEGKTKVYGVVDSIRGRNRSSFERYQYPSTLPISVRRRMTQEAERIIAQTGLDDSPFNIEFFWHRTTNRIWLLEINARISKSHSPLFEKVEGVPHNEVMIDVAIGQQPEYPLHLGRFRHAAKFMWRRYDCSDSDIVLRVPTAEEVSALERRFPGTEIKIHVAEGMRLGDLHFRDSYSHELAEIFIGAQSQSALMKRYREIVASLPIQIERGK